MNALFFEFYYFCNQKNITKARNCENTKTIFKFRAFLLSHVPRHSLFYRGVFVIIINSLAKKIQNTKHLMNFVF